MINNLNKNSFSIPFLVVRIIAIIMLLCALKIQPDSYYMLLRWLVFTTGAFIAFKFIKLDKSILIKILGCIVFAGLAVLFNPVFHIHLTRSIWSNLDITGAVVLLISIFLVRK